MLRCIWAFLSDPVNQKTLAWIFTGIAALIPGLWAALKIWFKNRSKKNSQSDSEVLRLTLQVSVAIVVIVGARMAFWIYSEAKSNCCSFAEIQIKAPLDGATISTPSVIYGEVTHSRVSRNVYVSVSDIGSGTSVKTGPTPTSGNGDWSARLDLSHVNRGERAKVQAFVACDLPEPWPSSNIIKLWRQ